MGFVSEPITPDPLQIDLPRRPVLTFWVVAVALEVLLGVAFLATGADAAIEEGLAQAGLDFSSDLLTAVRVVVVYPAALLGVTLALAQVAAPDLAVLVVARIRGGRTLLNAVGSRFRPWSKEVGAGRGIRIWLTVVVVFSACNIASGLLHGTLVADDFTWHLSWSMLALLPVAMFLDAGALLEENGWRGFALPVLLRTHGPVAASLIVGLAWASWHFPVKFDAFLAYGVWGALAYLGAFTVKIVAISVVITFFWARAGQATLLAVAMHGLSNDVARVGGLVDGTTWQSSAISELDLAVPFIILALVLVPYANRTGWGDLTTLAREGTSDIGRSPGAATLPSDRLAETALPHAGAAPTRQPRGDLMAFKFEIFNETTGEYRFRLVSGSGEVVVTSGPYATKADAKQGIKEVVRAGLDSGIADQTGED